MPVFLSFRQLQVMHHTIMHLMSMAVRALSLSVSVSVPTQ
jgi:hypothetical protein